MRRRLSGLYFVVDPTMPRERLLKVLGAALRGGVDVVQVWAAWKRTEDSRAIVDEVARVTRGHGVPLLINDDLDMARKVGAEGVHMDAFELAPSEIRRLLGEDSIVGYTVGNDLSRVEWADREGADYVSFCSIFPSPSVADCEIVPLSIVRKARGLTSIPIFASGGITLNNAREVLEAGTDGVAIVSAIQKSDDPEATASQFRKIIDSALGARGSGKPGGRLG